MKEPDTAIAGYLCFPPNVSCLSSLHVLGLLVLAQVGTDREGNAVSGVGVSFWCVVVCGSSGAGGSLGAGKKNMASKRIVINRETSAGCLALHGPVLEAIHTHDGEEGINGLGGGPRCSYGEGEYYSPSVASLQRKSTQNDPISQRPHTNSLLKSSNNTQKSILYIHTVRICLFRIFSSYIYIFTLMPIHILR